MGSIEGPSGPPLTGLPGAASVTSWPTALPPPPDPSANVGGKSGPGEAAALVCRACAHGSRTLGCGFGPLGGPALQRVE